MLEHVRVIGVIGLVRGLVGALLGGTLLFKGHRLTLADYRDYDMLAETVKALRSFDESAFVILGWLCLFMALLRTVQAIAAFWRAWWARPLGLGLAVFDILNLVLFPVSTALGLYALVVYRSPAIAAHFKGSAQVGSTSGSAFSCEKEKSQQADCSTP